MFTSSRSVAKRTVILGTSPLARELVEIIDRSAPNAYALVGVVGRSETDDARPFPCPVLGSLKDLERIVIEHQAERIVVALAERRGRLPAHQLVEARLRRGIVVEDGVDVYERFTGKLAIDSLTPINVVYSQDFQPCSLALAVARVLSLCVASVGLIGLAPLFGLIAVAIKCDSRGSVVFAQDRVGLGGRRFQLLKFRTMHPIAGQRSEWARDNGDRITRVGRWLRRFRLDELPQFVNILRGDMNLVGPRPHPVTNFELFSLVSRNTPQCGAAIPYYELRSMIRPGITGWAQVRYRYANDLEEEMEKMRYDLYYIKHYSVWLDLQIIFETVKMVLVGREFDEATASAPASPGRRETAHPAGTEVALSQASRFAATSATPAGLLQTGWARHPADGPLVSSGRK